MVDEERGECDEPDWLVSIELFVLFESFELFSFRSELLQIEGVGVLGAFSDDGLFGDSIGVDETLEDVVERSVGEGGDEDGFAEFGEFVDHANYEFGFACSGHSLYETELISCHWLFIGFGLIWV